MRRFPFKTPLARLLRMSRKFRMDALLFRCFVALIFLVSAENVGMARTATPTYCIAIAADGEDKLILAERFDDFARTANLFIDRSHPMIRTYTPEDVASPVEASAMIDLEMMGPLGFILTYMPLRNSSSTELLDKLIQFVADDIAPAYRIRRCDEIEGFTPPVLYY
jgi:hypothetical protein